MSEVHRAMQLAMNRSVALKVLTLESLAEPARQLRFTREAELIAQLSHPNVVQVFDFGVDRATKLPFLVFELVEGKTLLEVIRSEGPQSEARAAMILEQVARALAHAHHHGIVHRDLKPANVMLTDRGDGGDPLVKVLDFGIAKLLGDDGGLRLTEPGKLYGTPAFASPEQMLGDRIDERSDLYSLGCLLHALATGRAPFTSSDPAEMARLKRQGEAPPLPEVLRGGSHPSRELVALHRRLLSRAPSDRPARALDVADQLARIAKEARVADTVESATDVVMPTDVVQPTEIATHPGEKATVFKDTMLGETVLVPEKRRLRWPLFAAALLVLGAILIGGSLLRSPDPIAVERPIAAEPPVSPSVSPRPERVVVKQVRVVTIPPDAEVELGGASAGKSPIDLMLRLNDLPLAGKVHKPGHDPRTFSIDLNTPEQITIELPRKKSRKKADKPDAYPVW